jgi:lipopolysaccharide biosynthesis glycosyltransferase
MYGVAFSIDMKNLRFIYCLNPDLQNDRINKIRKPPRGYKEQIIKVMNVCYPIVPQSLPRGIGGTAFY